MEGKLETDTITLFLFCYWKSVFFFIVSLVEFSNAPWCFFNQYRIAQKSMKNFTAL